MKNETVKKKIYVAPIVRAIKVSNAIILSGSQPDEVDAKKATFTKSWDNYPTDDCTDSETSVESDENFSSGSW